MSHFNTRNLRHTVRGMRGTVAQLAAHFGVVPVKVALSRVTKSGWSIERAVTEPLQENMSRSEQ